MFTVHVIQYGVATRVRPRASQNRETADGKAVCACGKWKNLTRKRLLLEPYEAQLDVSERPHGEMRRPALSVVGS